MVDFAALLATVLIFIGAVLLWARASKLDLGLRLPQVANVWPWALLFIAWCLIEWVIFALIFPELGTVDPVFLEEMRRLSLMQKLVLVVLLVPLFEELLVRGALFSVLIRRWGIWSAAVFPNLLWGMLHVQYGWWLGASIAGSGMVLTITRWKSGSLYVPLALHAAYNFVMTLIDPLSPPAT